jgi:hypothetical protein
MNIKRITAVILLLVLALLITATPVFANGKPHFGKVNASGPDASGNLTVYVTSTGLFSVSVNARRDAIYACKPSDEDFPPNPMPREEVIDTGIYNDFVGHCDPNQVCRGKLIIPPPATSLSCEGDTKAALAMITYSELFAFGVYGDMHWVDKPINGNYSATYYGYTP